MVSALYKGCFRAAETPGKRYKSHGRCFYQKNAYDRQSGGCGGTVVFDGGNVRQRRDKVYGTVNINDVTVIQRILADLEQDTKGDVIRSCDLDDNALDIADATNIQCYLAEFESPYQIGKTFSYDEYELPFIPN